MTATTPQADAFSKGLAGIVAGRTAISSLDGDLRYRGYSIEPLALAGDFEETAYLLRSPHNAKRLIAAIENLENGQGQEQQLRE